MLKHRECSIVPKGRRADLLICDCLCVVPQGADASIADKRGKTPIDVASLAGRLLWQLLVVSGLC